jgi:hypothetical protein
MIELGDFSVKFLRCGYIYRKFMVVFIKVCGPCISSCKVQVCWRCLDRGLIIIIKLHERWRSR